ncbi:MAG: hypothetical protein CMQ41_07810 [Gammaproteobacteria bacterium]|nr:hypothetical protein [Gammaproteobacteria bacterium]
MNDLIELATGPVGVFALGFLAGTAFGDWAEPLELAGKLLSKAASTLKTLATKVKSIFGPK